MCKTFSSFYALRFFLGTLEACVTPGLILIVSMWYKSDERATRIGWFYAGNLSTSIVGGGVAYGVTFYNGSIAPWKLLYLILGTLAICNGIIVVLFLPDSPTTARFLSDEERIAALERVRLDQAGTHNKQIKRYQIVETFKDVRTWVMFIIIMCIGIPNGKPSFKSAICLETLADDLAQVATLHSATSSPRASVGPPVNPCSSTCLVPLSGVLRWSLLAGSLTASTTA